MATVPILLPASANEIPEQLWDEAGWLPCQLSIELAVHHFTVRDLLKLEANTILDTQNTSVADLPVRVNRELIGWAEFEVVGQHLAVRLTELA
jgi:flagellar motor switch/type III secretory pathway protein FliN